MFEDIEDPRKQALLALAAGLLTPQSNAMGRGSQFAAALSHGINAGLLGYNEASQSQRRNKLTDAQLTKSQLENAALQRATDQQAKIDALAPKYFSPAVTQDDPTSMQYGQSTPEKADFQGYTQALTAISPEKGIGMQAQLQQLMAKNIQKYGKNDRAVDMTNPNAPRVVLDAAPNLKPLDMGGGWQFYDENSSKPVGPVYPKSIPLEKAFDMAIAEYNAKLAGARAADEGIPAPAVPRPPVAGMPQMPQGAPGTAQGPVTSPVVPTPQPPAQRAPAAPVVAQPTPPTASAPPAKRPVQEDGLPTFIPPAGLSGKAAREWQLKTAESFPQDVATLQSSAANMARLRSTAMQLKNHPGLAGITGRQSMFPNMPGGHAADAAALLENLRSVVGFDVLQDMRNASKTGGALGNVSDAEGKRLENNLAALANAQSYGQFVKELDKIISYTDTAQSRLSSAFSTKYGADKIKNLRGGATGDWGSGSDGFSIKRVR